jgi:ribulose-5-phosphate 4-epimerase/fuculose-1-phosphate aldolase
VNIHSKASTSPATTMSSAEWQARVDLAAVYRLVAHHGWDDVIYDHAGVRDTPGRRPTFSHRHLSQKPRPTLS